MGENFEKKISLVVQLSIYLCYGILILFGHIHDWKDTLLRRKSKPPKGYAPITRDFEEFFRRRIFHRIEDCWNRPITGPAGRRITVLQRDLHNDLKLTGEKVNALNLASYNYLGFAEIGSPCEEHVLKALDHFGVSTASSPYYSGQTREHVELEQKVAEFVGTEDAMIFGMGWGTNSTGISTLVGKGCLIMSDSLNHNSIIIGARSSGAVIKPFPHNNVKGLEKIIRKSIVEGQPRTHRPWKKILIIVEGVYSMEGEICNLNAIVELKKKYKCYLYVDEAHSIGATGNTGRGVCEHRNINPRDVDVLMGTFTKSFGAIGGYVAGSKKLISAIRRVCASQLFSSGLSPACVAQIKAALRIIQSDEGKKRVNQLRDNSNFFRKSLEQIGLQCIGDYDSAVVPVFIGNPAKMNGFSKECLRRGIALVIVGFPATTLLTGRVRFCLSSAHTRKDLEEAVKIIKEVSETFHFQYENRILG